MFRRTFWFTAGAAAGVWATTKVNRKIRALAPDSLAAQAAHRAVDAGQRLKEFALDVRDGMAQREVELGEALGLSHSPDGPDLPGAAGQVLPHARRRPTLGPAGKGTAGHERASGHDTTQPTDQEPHEKTTGYAAGHERTAYRHDRNEDH